MRDLRLSLWLLAASVYALYNGFDWGHWRDLALWTRIHASIDVITGLCMLSAGGIWILSHNPWRPLIYVGIAAPSLLGISLIAGTMLGTIPCTGSS